MEEGSLVGVAPLGMLHTAGDGNTKSGSIVLFRESF